MSISRTTLFTALTVALRHRTLFAFLFAALLGCAYIAQEQAAPFTGYTKVHDGDSLRVNNEKFRLHGIDAPELDQTCTKSGVQWECGIAARDYLISLIGHNTASCTKVGKSYDRLVGKCTVLGKDLAQAMVNAGYAVADPRYSKAYVVNQKQAQNDKIGIWTSEFIMPWDWRNSSKN